MLTRKEYLDNPTEENHKKYYMSIAFEANIKVSTFTFQQAINAYRRKDYNMDYLHPKTWNEMLNDIYINKFVEYSFKRRGDRLTKSTAGCLLKEAIQYRMQEEHPELLKNSIKEETNVET